MSIYTEQVIDFTPMLELQDTPNTLVSSLDLFDTYRHGTDVVSVGRESIHDVLIPARERAGERNFITTSAPELKPFRIPFFPLDKNIKAQDIQSFRSFISGGVTDVLRTQEEVVNRYMTAILRAHARTKETILTQAVMGNAYVGVGGSVNSNYNWYDAWGVTQESVELDFTSTTVNPTTVIESDARGFIIDNKQDGSDDTTIIALCGRKFFANIVNNVFVRSAYQYFAGTPNPLRDRISQNFDAQVFVFNGVTYIEDIHNNVPTDEAYVLPRGIDGMFQSHLAPADTPEYANTLAQDTYVFMNNEHRQVSLQSEFSMLAVNTRPELVVKLTTATA